MVQAQFGALAGSRHEVGTGLSTIVLGPVEASPTSFAALPHNFEAFEAATQFARGRLDYVALVGPSGWGKTSLLQVAAETADKAGVEHAIIVNALDFLKRQDLHETPRSVLIDQVHDVRRRPRERQRMRVLVERRLAHRRPTMLCFDGDNCGRLLREMASLSHSCRLVRISEPAAHERELIVMHLARKLNLSLHRTIAHVIGRHLHGNARSIVGALKNLCVYKAQWRDDEDVTKACGILSPFLRGEDGWDLRDVACDAVIDLIGTNDKAEDFQRWFCWLTRRDVGLPEWQVAAFLKVEPTEVYSWSRQVGAKEVESMDYLRRCFIMRLSDQQSAGFHLH